MVYIAFLRGINVGGKNRMLMSDLRRIFSEAGAEEVETFIQSGNVIFNASEENMGPIEVSISAAMREHMGKPIPLVICSAPHFAKATVSHPHEKQGFHEKNLFVMFLKHIPLQEHCALLDFQRSPGDQYLVVEDTIYLAFGNGAANTKLSNAYFDAKLRTISTSRNWKTVCQINHLISTRFPG